MSGMRELQQFTIVSALCEKKYNELFIDYQHGVQDARDKMIITVRTLLKAFCWFMKNDPKMRFFYDVDDRNKGMASEGVTSFVEFTDLVELCPRNLQKFYVPHTMVVEYDWKTHDLNMGYEQPDGIVFMEYNGKTFRERKGIFWMRNTLGYNYKRKTITESFLHAIMRLYETGSLLRTENLYRGRLDPTPGYKKWAEDFCQRTDAGDVPCDISAIFK